MAQTSIDYYYKASWFQSLTYAKIRAVPVVLNRLIILKSSEPYTSA